MIKEFETLKGQLQELSHVINSFKSEAVQLKIIEMLFNDATVKKTSGNSINVQQELETQSTEISGRTSKQRRRKIKLSEGNGAEKRSSTIKGRPGPNPTLNSLVDEGFFATKKTIGDVIDHCRVNLAYTFKSTDFSGPLGKLVREKKLRREQNPDTNQYEYINY